MQECDRVGESATVSWCGVDGGGAAALGEVLWESSFGGWSVVSGLACGLLLVVAGPMVFGLFPSMLGHNLIWSRVEAGVQGGVVSC